MVEYILTARVLPRRYQGARVLRLLAAVKGNLGALAGMRLWCAKFGFLVFGLGVVQNLEKCSNQRNLCKILRNVQIETLKNIHFDILIEKNKCREYF